MRKPVLIIGALAAAGFVAFAGGSAFTDSNTMPTLTTAGYGSVSASGATITAVHYLLDTDATKLATVTFHTNDLSHSDALPSAQVSLSNTVGPVAVGTFTCGAYTPDSTVTDGGTFSCDLTGGTPGNGVTITAFNQTAITVLS